MSFRPHPLLPLGWLRALPRLFQESSLLVPTVSIANVPQLAADALIATMLQKDQEAVQQQRKQQAAAASSSSSSSSSSTSTKTKKATPVSFEHLPLSADPSSNTSSVVLLGTYYSQHLRTCVGNDAVTHLPSHLTKQTTHPFFFATSSQVFYFPTLSAILLHIRSPLLEGHQLLFLHELTDWINRCKFTRVLIPSSTFAAHQQMNSQQMDLFQSGPISMEDDHEQGFMHDDEDEVMLQMMMQNQQVQLKQNVPHSIQFLYTHTNRRHNDKEQKQNHQEVEKLQDDQYYRAAKMLGWHSTSSHDNSPLASLSISSSATSSSIDITTHNSHQTFSSHTSSGTLSFSRPAMGRLGGAEGEDDEEEDPLCLSTSKKPRSLNDLSLQEGAAQRASATSWHAQEKEALLQRIPLLGFSRFILDQLYPTQHQQAEHKEQVTFQCPVLLLHTYVNEGDNAMDGIILARQLYDMLYVAKQLKENKSETDVRKLVSEAAESIRWTSPYSWSFVFGNEPEADLYL